jgi:hypothetical protein
MSAAKQLADLITWSRVLLAFGLAGLGFAYGPDSLPLVAWLMIADWTGDCLDGAIARRSKTHIHTWIGDHDLETDMLVSFGLSIYLVAAGFVDLWLVAAYVLIWAVIFWRWGVPKSLGMLIQAPIYGWLIVIAIRDAPVAGWAIVIWIAAVIAITWPKFPREVVPGFLTGMRQAWNGHLHLKH